MKRPTRLFNRPPRRRGFVLLMTLALLAIAGLMLAGMAGRSLNAAQFVADRHRDIQHRWGCYSIQRSILNRTESILAAAERTSEHEDRSHDPLTSVVCRVTLAGEAYAVQLSDESAKIDLNVVHELGTKQSVRRILSRTIGAGSRIELRPYDRSGSRSPAYDSWGQVFGMADDGRRIPNAGETVRNATAAVTLWGGGSLNARRASPETIEALFRVLGVRGGQRILRLRDEHPHWSLDQILTAAGLAASDEQTVREHLSWTSQSASLWIGPPGSAPQLHILERRGRQLYTRSFEW